MKEKSITALKKVKERFLKPRNRPPTYKKGECFVLFYKENYHVLQSDPTPLYVLCAIEPYTISLVNIFTGDAWNWPVEVSDPLEITQQEWLSISDTDSPIKVGFKWVKANDLEHAINMIHGSTKVENEWEAKT